MSNTVHGECALKDRRHSCVRITLVMDHDTRPAETIPRVWYDSSSIKSQSFRGVMGGYDIAIISFYGLSEERFCASENCLAVGRNREVVYACSRMDEVVVRS